MIPLDQYKNSLVAKIAARAAYLYETAATTIREASPPVKHILPPDWLPHIEAKSHHFKAVAELRKSMDDFEASRYGIELARLGQAQVEAKEAYDISRRGRVASPVLQDAQSLLETVRKSLTRAQRDNDLIYHQDVPAASALPAIQQTNLAAATIPAGLLNPASILGSKRPIFGDLVGWGAREAINIYNDRKHAFVKERVVDVAQELQDEADDQLRKLNLPSTLEALERPIGLPPSLLRKAEEVRLEDGPAKIQAALDDVERLAEQDESILEEAMDILDNEASEDETARKEIPLNRLRSHEANVELIEKQRRYREILKQARRSDSAVRQKWDEWEANITELTLDEADLEASVPSSTFTSAVEPTPESRKTRNHARALRVKLEELDTLRRDQKQLAHRAQSLAKADDIRPIILRAASGFERLTEVEPHMFEDVSDEQLAKYDKFLMDMSELAQKQSVILQDIKNGNEAFLRSRLEDPVVKQRELALQSLDLAYFKYKEITRNLDEGNKFYNDLAGILMQFKEVCKSWSHARNQEIHSLTRSVQSMSVRDNVEDKTPKKARLSPPRSPATIGSTRKPTGKSALGLPAITLSDLGFEEIPLPPGPPEPVSR